MADLASSPVPRFPTNASVSPPGENVGLTSALGWRVSWTGARPPSPASQMSWLLLFSAVSTEVTTNAGRGPRGGVDVGAEKQKPTRGEDEAAHARLRVRGVIRQAAETSQAKPPTDL